MIKFPNMMKKENWNVKRNRKCPFCGMRNMYENDIQNSLSRRDNKTYICNRCGNEEAIRDLSQRIVRQKN